MTGDRDISLCIFDLDGVIVDTAKYHYAAWKRLADTFDYNLSKERNEQLKGVSRIDSLDAILEWAGKSFSTEEMQEMTQQKNSWYLKSIEQISKEDALPGVVDFILELRDNNIKTAVGSASKNAKYILKCLDIYDLFDVIVDGGMTKIGKPNPEVFLLGAALTMSHSSEVIVFEDAVKGVDAAHNAKMRVVGIGDALVLSHADVVISGFQDFKLVDLVKMLSE